jgi:pimeloyl-ACP methyl ester carboxylesterase
MALVADRARARTRDVVVGSGEAAVEAYVVEPGDAPVRAGILFLHWLGERHSDRTQFLSEAREYARIGVRCVLPAGRFPWGADPVDASTDVANLEIEQDRLAAGLDALAAGLAPGTPLALVGHDFGAMHGMVLARRRPRFRAAVIVAATPRWADWFLRFWDVSGDRFEYGEAFRPTTR